MTLSCALAADAIAPSHRMPRHRKQCVLLSINDAARTWAAAKRLKKTSDRGFRGYARMCKLTSEVFIRAYPRNPRFYNRIGELKNQERLVPEIAGLSMCLTSFEIPARRGRRAFHRFRERAF